VGRKFAPLFSLSGMASQTACPTASGRKKVEEEKITLNVTTQHKNMNLNDFYRGK
jgi:hypothetical protein